MKGHLFAMVVVSLAVSVAVVYAANKAAPGGFVAKITGQNIQ